MLRRTKRPALGQLAELGALYDARTDSFTGISILSSPAPASGVKVHDSQTVDVRISHSETYGEKLSRMDISAELGASFLSGMIDVHGSGSYLTEVHESEHIVQMSLHYNITTVDEKLNFTDNELTKCLQSSALQSGAATHFVTGIGWGARSIVTVKHRMSHNDDRTEIEGRFQAEFNKLKSVIKICGKAELQTKNEEQRKGMSFDVTVHGDALANDCLLPTDLESAYKFIQNVPAYIASANCGKGKPITYTLIPLNFLACVLDVEIKADFAIKQPRLDCLERFVQFFDALCKSKQKLNDYYLKVEKHKFCVPAAYRDEVVEVVSKLKLFEAAQKSSYARVLKEVRSGHANSEELCQLLDDALKVEDMSPEGIVLLTNKYCQKIEFADSFISKGATYIGDDVESLKRELISSLQYDDAYVFHFNEDARHKQSSWEGNLLLLVELLDDTEGKKVIIMVDSDASGAKMEKSYIMQYQNGIVVCEDLLEENQLMAGKSLARHPDEKLLDESSRVEKPLRRSPVRIRCPGRYCIQDSQLHDWICLKCHALLEYADRYIYCDCGRAIYSNYKFKCKEKKHGSQYAHYPSCQLLGLLNELEPFPQLNILILGETGVGKSTFINAFIKYLTFDTLHDGLNDEELHWVIPCSFSTQTVDPTDPSGNFVSRDIKIGHSDSEHDGAAGESATQKTSIYPVLVGGTIVRLIDTPGIGDTRGVEKDKENMANILGTLRNFSNLHGILILLKPNNSRLTVMFRFCVKELLTHLHRDAVKNMVFGFTNTRISNYKPGDTFKPLEALLQEHDDVGMTLTRHTVYCYDSESFRFLAARKSGVEMDNIDDFRRSWQHSRDEAQRLLKHFGTVPPHLVRSTISVNGTRELITQLTKPMADIVQSIETTIQVNEDNLREFDAVQLQGDNLRGRLHFQKVVLGLRELEMPRTVCSEGACVEYRDDGYGQMQTVYKTICHNVCHLKEVTVKVVGCPALAECAAMGPNGHCNRWAHHFLQHVHVRYEHYDERVTVKDSAIEEQLQQNATDITLKKTAIDMIKKKVCEAKAEHKQIQDAAVKFGLFLKKHSITPYNDAMLEYLDHQIREESGKVNWLAQQENFNGTGRERLENLQRRRKEYAEEIEAITRSMRSGGKDEVLVEDAVDHLVQSLYSLPHWGQNLKDIKLKAESADMGAYREQPYCVGRNRPSRQQRGDGRNRPSDQPPVDVVKNKKGWKFPMMPRWSIL